MSNPLIRPTPRAFCILAILLAAACSSDPSKDLPPDNPFKNDPNRQSRELRAEAGTLYKAARKSLDSGDFAGALTRYDQIAARYPFTEYATQCDLERVYAQYRSYDPDKALFSADKFLREHPRHPAADYVQYLKGLINFDRETGFSAFLGLDTTKEDVSNARRAFDDFALLVQKYPESRYTADARQRMIFLRNRLAQHDMHVVRYYVKRGAHIAAAKRAEQVITQYPGAPVTREALQVMEKSYRALGLTQQADDAAKLLAANVIETTAAPTAAPAPPAKTEREPWSYTLIIPGGAKQETAAPQAAATSAEAPSANENPAAPAAEKSSSRLSVTMEPYDDEPAQPAAAPAAPESASP